MTQVRIFEQAMCCSTGVCAANLDPEAPLLQQRAGYELPLIDQVRPHRADSLARR